MKDFDVGVMNGNDAARMWAAGPKSEEKKESPRESVDSDESVGSHISIKALRKSLTQERRGNIKGESTHVRLHLDDCTVEAEKEPTAGRWKQSALTDFRHLCGAGGYRDGLIKGLEMYGFKTPNRCQQHLIPVVLYFLGKYLEGFSDEKGAIRSTVSIQGPTSGKTSSVVLASLATVDTSIQQPQAIFVSRSSKLEIEKFLRVLALTGTFSYQSFNQDETGLDLDIDPASPEIVAAKAAHVIVGHPARLRKAFATEAVSLNAVKVLVVDDAHELFHGGRPSVGGESPGAQARSSMKLSGLPSGEKSGLIEGGASASNEADAAAASASATSAIEDVVEICKMLDMAKAVKIPYLIVAEEGTDKATKRMMKMLKSSMSIKKNLLSVESCTPPTKLIKAMKHYYAETISADWVHVFAGLVQALTFPRALIYCDDENIHKYFGEMQSMGIAVSANLPGATAEARRSALGDFSANKTQFLLTHSEPAVCQIMLPKVSCVFHFGTLPQLPSVYGVRLSPLDEKLKKESASILLVDPDADKPKAAKDFKAKDTETGGLHPVVAKLQKIFNISFMDMPLEMLPARPGRK